MSRKQKESRHCCSKMCGAEDVVKAELLSIQRRRTAQQCPVAEARELGTAEKRGTNAKEKTTILRCLVVFAGNEVHKAFREKECKIKSHETASQEWRRVLRDGVVSGSAPQISQEKGEEGKGGG